MKKADIILIAAVTIVAAAFFFINSHNDSGLKVVVLDKDNNIIWEESLMKDCTETITSENGYNIVVIKNGQVYVKDADCKNRICVDSKAISRKGQSIVCMPHKIAISIK